MQHIGVEREDSIAIVTLQRPESRNALGRQLVAELNSTLRVLQTEDEAEVIVIAAEGEAFCAGGDIDEVRAWQDQDFHEYAQYLRAVQDLVRELRASSKPSIAAVDGPAVGAGCDLALACDIRIIGQGAVFRESFVDLGLVPGDGGGWLLSRLIGQSKAKEYVLTGKPITAEAAVEVGLVAELVDSPLEMAKHYATSLADRPTLAVQYCNELADDSVSLESHLARALEYQWECANDPAHRRRLADVFDADE